jgi:anaerobic C4-dicarboxylate transporter
MPIVIEIVMMSVAALMLLVDQVDVDDVPKTRRCGRRGRRSIGIFGLAWLGDSFIAANKDVIVPAIGAHADAQRVDVRVRAVLRFGACSTARRATTRRADAARASRSASRRSS